MLCLQKRHGPRLEISEGTGKTPEKVLRSCYHGPFSSLVLHTLFSLPPLYDAESRIVDRNMH